jgi:hypothetical protein
MAHASFDDLYDGFVKVVRDGTEADARKFIVDHFAEFPGETQDAIITAFFMEGVAKQVEDEKILADFKKEGTAFVDSLDKLKTDLEAKKKLMEIRGEA